MAVKDKIQRFKAEASELAMCCNEVRKILNGYSDNKNVALVIIRLQKLLTWYNGVPSQSYVNTLIDTIRKVHNLEEVER